MDAVVVEVLDRLGRVRERLRVASPFTIGRGYSCDVILDDPFVSPEHVRIERRDDGTLVAVDLGSTNGTLGVEPPGRAGTLALGAGGTIRIGHATLRLRTAAFAVEPARPQRGGPGLAALGVWSSLGLVLLATLAVAGDRALGTYDELTASRLLFAVLPIAVVVVGWAGAWALASRMVSHRTHFREHLVTASLAAWAFLWADRASDYVAFAFSAERAGNLLGAGALGLVLAVVLYRHLRLCSGATPHRLAAAAGGVSLALIAMVAFAIHAVEAEFTTSLDFSSTLKPPVFRLARARSVDEFLRESVRLQAEADALARER